MTKTSVIATVDIQNRKRTETKGVHYVKEASDPQSDYHKYFLWQLLNPYIGHIS